MPCFVFVVVFVCSVTDSPLHLSNHRFLRIEKPIAQIADKLFQPIHEREVNYTNVKETNCNAKNTNIVIFCFSLFICLETNL